jgi:hypothetical protein
MKKVIFEEVNRCDECPYFHHQEDSEYAYDGGFNGWFECGYTDQIIIGDKELMELKNTDPFQYEIPDWCPLENYDLFHKAIDIVKGDA